MDGDTMTMIWSAKMDEQTCRFCREMNGQRSECEQTSAPHPACRNPNGCRCVEISVGTEVVETPIGNPPMVTTQRVTQSMTNVVKMVDHPSHYGGRDSIYEHVKVALALGWHGNAFIYNCTKYLWRVGKKSGAPIIQDLMKARWYLDQEIQRLEAEDDGDQE